MRLESDAKFEEKLTRGLENNMKNLENFNQSTWKWGSKLGLLWVTFIPSRKCMRLKFTRELCSMTMKKDAKFEKELTSSKRHEEFSKFWPKHSKISNICTLMKCFWRKYLMLQIRKYSGCLMTLEIDKKKWRKTDLFQKWPKFGEFWS